METQDLAGAQRKSRRQGRLIVSIDKSELSDRPTRVRTWAPKGQPPGIQFHFNLTHISVIAGLSRTNCPAGVIGWPLEGGTGHSD